MFSAATRLSTFGAFGLLTAMTPAVVGGEGAQGRAAPTRPVENGRSPATARKFGGFEYLPASRIAVQLGMEVGWLERGRRLALTAADRRAEIEAASRESLVNGVRVFLGNPVIESNGELYVSRMDLERCLTPLLRPGFGVAPRRQPKIIALDPGHGGKDTGTSALEKTYALDVAVRAKKKLEAAGYKVVLTRSTDVFVELPQRAAAANAARADLFVSIHFNALAKDSKTRGVEIYTFPPRHQNSANSWGPGKKPDAESEAASVNTFDHWNVVLAHSLHRQLLDRLKAPDRGKKLMHLAVLRPLKCPGALVECGFLTSDVEAARIATPAYRQEIAEALSAGIRAYAQELETAGSARPAKAAIVSGAGGSTG
jgi:N-acetylmuramoyl-L-alanine amidase